MEGARMSWPGNAKPVLTGDIYDSESFAGDESAGSIDLGHNKTIREEIHHMAEQTSGTKVVEVHPPKPLNQTYFDEVEALKSQGMSNADAVREVAKKHDKNENAVRGGIHQFKTKHSGSSGPTATVRRLRQKAASVDDLVATARQALESARDLIEQEVTDAKAALDAAQARYDEVAASVKDRKADIEKKLAALS